MKLPYSFFILSILTGLLAACRTETAEQPPAQAPFTITAYYAGDANGLDAYPVEKLTHIVFSFCHLQGNRLSVDDQKDSLTIQKMVSLKSRNPEMKVLLSLGGWGGCETCSDVFSTQEGRKEFVASLKELQSYFGTDGIDLDWEYPGISGYPGHTFKPEDRENFTYLVQELRKEMGESTTISFAAGGFDRFFDNSVDWAAVMPLVDRVNIMTYDFVTGCPMTGHHTNLYSTPEQERSANHAIRYLDSLGVPRSKMVIGAAFYGRVWENVEPLNNGLFQAGTAKESVHFKRLDDYFTEHPGFQVMWDSTAQAPYAYDPQEKLFLTFDNKESVTKKTEYAKTGGLNGVMFWQLVGDKTEDGLLGEMYKASR